MFKALIRSLSLTVLLVAAVAVLAFTRPALAWTSDEVFYPGYGVRLHAMMFTPDGPGPFPAVVALHGCSGLMTRRDELSQRHRDWAERLVTQGFVVLLPDSYESRNLEPQCRNADRTIRPARERVADANASYVYLASLPRVKKSAISLLGWSNGGSSVLYAVMTKNAPESRGDFAKAISFYPGCRLPLESGQWQSRMPLLIMIGAADDWTPAAPCDTLAKQADARGQAVELKIYPNAYHDFDHPNLPVHVVEHLAFTASGAGSAHTGTNAEARADSIERVVHYLAR